MDQVAVSPDRQRAVAPSRDDHEDGLAQRPGAREGQGRRSGRRSGRPTPPTPTPTPRRLPRRLPRRRPRRGSSSAPRRPSPSRAAARRSACPSTSRSRSRTPDARVTRAVIAIHGTSGGAADYWDYAAAGLKDVSGVLLVAPKFAIATEAPAASQLYWPTAGEWSKGGLSSAAGRPWMPQLVRRPRRDGRAPARHVREPAHRGRHRPQRRRPVRAALRRRERRRRPALRGHEPGLVSVPQPREADGRRRLRRPRRRPGRLRRLQVRSQGPERRAVRRGGRGGGAAQPLRRRARDLPARRARHRPERLRIST